jgi:hypothetical protein
VVGAKQQVSGEALPSFYLGENFTLPQNGVAPEIKVPSRKEDRKMFQGTTIEELINSVVRAEEHARQQEKTAAPGLDRQYGFRPFVVRQEMVEVA